MITAIVERLLPNINISALADVSDAVDVAMDYPDGLIEPDHCNDIKRIRELRDRAFRLLQEVLTVLVIAVAGKMKYDQDSEESRNSTAAFLRDAKASISSLFRGIENAKYWKSKGNFTMFKAHKVWCETVVQLGLKHCENVKCIEKCFKECNRMFKTKDALEHDEAKWIIPSSTQSEYWLLAPLMSSSDNSALTDMLNLERSSRSSSEGHKQASIFEDFRNLSSRGLVMATGSKFLPDLPCGHLPNPTDSDRWMVLSDPVMAKNKLGPLRESFSKVMMSRSDLLATQAGPCWISIQPTVPIVVH